jgi:hypothetical protein
VGKSLTFDGSTYRVAILLTCHEGIDDSLDLRPEIGKLLRLMVGQTMHEACR